MDDLKTFSENNKLIKNPTNEVFICDFTVSESSGSPTCLEFSSKSCMRFLDKALSSPTPMLAIDGTFKLNSVGFPLLCVVTQDAYHEIFPIAFAPANTESEETISFTLNALIKAYNILYSKTLKIKYFMSDNAQYTFNAVSKVFGVLEGGHLNCYFHLKERQRKKALSEHGVAKEDRQHILDHLDIMQTMITKNHFEKYWTLFTNKYCNYKSYCDYFAATYINSRMNKWHFFDIEANVFLTNNICESLNATLKRDWTNRERKPLHIFFTILKDCLIDLAKENKVFKLKVEPKTDHKILASDLEKKNLFVKRNNYYFLDREEKVRPSHTMLTNYLTANYDNIEEFKSNHQSLIVLSWNSILKKATCFCRKGFLQGLCHHKIALEMTEGVIPKLLRLMPNKKRGRKRKEPLAWSKEEAPNPNEIPSQKAKKVKQKSRK